MHPDQTISQGAAVLTAPCGVVQSGSTLLAIVDFQKELEINRFMNEMKVITF